MNYRVSKKRGCTSPKGVYFAPGAEIEEGDFGHDRIKQLTAAGFLEAYDPKPDTPTSRAERPGRKGRVTPSIWNLDPAGLRGMSVEQLNVMVLERDAKVTPFETIEEAVWWLTQDYESIELEV